MSLFIILVNKQEFLFSFFSNLAVMLFKFGAYLYTGSATMLSESIFVFTESWSRDRSHAKTTAKKSIRILSNFFAIITSRLFCQM